MYPNQNGEVPTRAPTTASPDPTRSLSTFCDQDSPAVTLTSTGQDVVVLGPDQAGAVAVYTNGTCQHLDPGQSATAIPDPAKADRLRRQALAWYTRTRRDDRAYIETLEDQLRQTRNASRHTREAIRSYAIGRYREGAYCLEGLNEFLEHFNMDPYQPRFKVSFTIRVNIELEPDTEGFSSVADHVSGAINVDASGIDGVDLTSLEIDVGEVTVDEIDDDTAR